MSRIFLCEIALGLKRSAVKQPVMAADRECSGVVAALGYS